MLFVSKGVHTPDGLAFDWIHKNLYWTDTGSKAIVVAHVGKGYSKTLIDTGLAEPRAIAVDPRPEQGLVYI